MEFFFHFLRFFSKLSSDLHGRFAFSVSEDFVNKLSALR
jgi:hypothetical protein